MLLHVLGGLPVLDRPLLKTDPTVVVAFEVSYIGGVGFRVVVRVTSLQDSIRVLPTRKTMAGQDCCHCQSHSTGTDNDSCRKDMNTNYRTKLYCTVLALLLQCE